ncbi:MAG: proline--tRNA ligase [Candidatus Kapaibacterium sp.]|nr:MAG: proline--tRNA ligase [Candidatus Kapabacteria bacterium]
MAKVITPRTVDYAEWYNDVVLRSGLAEYSAVRGCMIIKPLGYALWENMRAVLDQMFKETGHVNAYFPLFIPKSFLSREAQHVEGFAKECAVVTHHRLKLADDGSGVVVDPDAKLEEELIVRPTSETIIWHTYRDWIQSYRDLPLLINQWANVVRWELRTRPFLRTAEFLWQEGHTAHATRQEAIEEAERMLDVYARFAEEYMAMPVVRGIKTPSERFAGAEETYCIEALMQDGKALQAGTSHFLGQNFAKAFDVTFLDQNNQRQYVWATSWGVSTRLIGALVMTHSDDDGLVLPPRLAPVQVVIVTIPTVEEPQMSHARALAEQLQRAGLRVQVDTDPTKRAGFKFAEYELRGVPVRVAIGIRDIEAGTIEVARRDTKEKRSIPVSSAVEQIQQLLEEIQQNLLDRARRFVESNTHRVESFEEFERTIEECGGFVLAHWDGTAETEAHIKERTKATIRCIPLDSPSEPGRCIVTGKPSVRRVLFARAY